MLYPQDRTSDERHQRNNDLQLLVFYHQRPDLYARLVDGLSPDSRAHLEARLARMQAEAAAAGALLADYAPPAGGPPMDEC